jgi:hypothetical protein
MRTDEKNGYPKNWEEISLRIRVKRAKNKCEFCGLENHSVIMRTFGLVHHASKNEISILHEYARKNHISFNQTCKKFGFTRVILTTAHLNHNPADNRDENLKALCQKCHLNYDGHTRKWLERKTEGRKKVETLHED